MATQNGSTTPGVPNGKAEDSQDVSGLLMRLSRLFPHDLVSTKALPNAPHWLMKILDGWSYDEMPDLSGRVFIVTGGNSGVGFEMVRHLALHNAHVIIASHGKPRMADATNTLRELIKDSKGRVDYMMLDLSSLKSVRAFADSFRALGLPLHGLLNNAGVHVRDIERTEDNFELAIGTNFYGHFYLTHLLLDILKASGPSRVCNITSPQEARGCLDWNDLKGEFARLSTMDDYSSSEQMSLMSGLELGRRLAGSGVDVFVGSPGFSQTGVCRQTGGQAGGREDLFRKMDYRKPESTTINWLQNLLGQSAARGALSMVYTATAPELEGRGGEYYSPYYFKNHLVWPFLRGVFCFNMPNCMKVNPSRATPACDPNARFRFYAEAANLMEKELGAPLPNRVPAPV
ncbi:hypothetical protein N2152v2_004902 [Parachlorella kessleri]